MIADPGSFEGEQVRLGGFVAIRHGLLSLYASEEQYRSGVMDSESLILRAPQDQLQALAEKFHHQYVFVSGEYSSRFEGSRMLRLGTLLGVTEMSPSLSDLAPESIDDLRFHLSDFGSDASESDME